MYVYYCGLCRLSRTNMSRNLPDVNAGPAVLLTPKWGAHGSGSGGSHLALALASEAQCDWRLRLQVPGHRAQG
jgi:hypothetical protein